MAEKNIRTINHLLDLRSALGRIAEAESLPTDYKIGVNSFRLLGLSVLALAPRRVEALVDETHRIRAHRKPEYVSEVPENKRSTWSLSEVDEWGEKLAQRAGQKWVPIFR